MEEQPTSPMTAAVAAIAVDAVLRGGSGATAADLDALTAWRDGRLVFNDTPLPQVVAAFNRYSSDQLSLVPDARLNDIRISGSFRYDGAREFANALRAGFGVRVRQVDRTTWEIAE